MAGSQGGGQGFILPSISEFFVGGLVLSLIMIIIMPLPDFLLDIAISFNISLGIILIMMSLYVEKPLDIAAFPSIILVGTMLRLALGIAATRNILSRGEAGHVINAFGRFVFAVAPPPFVVMITPFARSSL